MSVSKICFVSLRLKSTAIGSTAIGLVLSSIQTRSHVFVEIGNETISTAVLLTPTDSRMVVVSYKQNYVH